jgi:SP family galactose:H+ symporter-like MFS transporter
MMTTSRSRAYVYAVSAIAAIAGLLLGFDTGIISGALLFIEKEFVISTELKELIVSSVLFGAMIGSPASGRLTDRFGRRKLMLLTAGLFIIGTLIAALAPDVYGIIGGRVLIGIAIGMGAYTAPLYIAEIAPFELRGALVTLNQLAITIGILCSYLINYAFTNMDSSWRWMFGIGIIPALLLSLGMLVLPESPRWLVKQNRLDEAKKILKQLRDTDDVSEEMVDIQRSLKSIPTAFREIFSPWVLPVLFLGAMMGFIQQVTGINTIIYYAPTIFQLAGFQDASSSILATVGIGIVNVIATVAAIYFLDRIGRRPLLLTGLAGMGVTMLTLSVAFYIGADNPMLRWVAIGCTFLYIICFAFSLGAMLWLLVAEIFPLEVRATAMSVAVLSCWFWNFFHFPDITQSIRSKSHFSCLHAHVCLQFSFLLLQSS